MSTTSTTASTVSSTFEIVPYSTSEGTWAVLHNGLYLRDKNYNIREFKTRNSARKRIARERSGNLHK